MRPHGRIKRAAWPRQEQLEQEQSSAHGGLAISWDPPEASSWKAHVSATPASMLPLFGMCGGAHRRYSIVGASESARATRAVEISNVVDPAIHTSEHTAMFDTRLVSRIHTAFAVDTSCQLPLPLPAPVCTTTLIINLRQSASLR